MATYNEWIESLGLPIHKGYYHEDLRTAEMGWWEERGCNTAFIELVGQEGVSESRVTEIAPGKTTKPWQFALDEIFYVLEGKGLTTVWRADQSTRKTFEWQKHSLFMIPRQSFCQLANAQGDKPARLVSYNYLPPAMQAVGDPEFFFNNPYVSKQGEKLEEFYSEAKAEWSEGETQGQYAGGRYTWFGNFFPDMRAWDKLNPFRNRGAGGHVVWISFPNSSLWAHMSVFPSRTYKKGHRHGPGVLIVIPSGEGFSVMWEEGKEKIFIPWHEGSSFVPPNRWFHQHFNVSGAPARYLALHAPRGASSERVQDPSRDQIEYPDEDPWIRQTFEKELAKRGLTSLMREEAYKDPNYQWDYAEDKG